MAETTLETPAQRKHPTGIGARVKRNEDPRLLTGNALFFDDVALKRTSSKYPGTASPAQLAAVVQNSSAPPPSQTTGDPA